MAIEELGRILTIIEIFGDDSPKGFFTSGNWIVPPGGDVRKSYIDMLEMVILGLKKEEAK